MRSDISKIAAEKCYRKFRKLTLNRKARLKKNQRNEYFVYAILFVLFLALLADKAIGFPFPLELAKVLY